MRAIWSVARISLQESLARNVFGVQFFVILSLGLLQGFTSGIPEDTERLKMFLDGGLTLAMLFSLFFSFAITWPQLEADRVHGRLLSLLSSYLSRGEYVWGKFFGCLLAVWLNLIVMFLILGGFVLLQGETPPSWLFLTGLAQLLEAGLLVAILMFCSIGMTRFMGVMSAIFIFVLGHFTYYVRYYAKILEEKWLGNMLEQLWLFLPNFEYFGLKNAYLASKPVPELYFPFLLAYTVGWILIFQVLSVLLFERKEY